MYKFSWGNFTISMLAFVIVFTLFRWYVAESHIPISECNAQKTEYFNRLNQEVFDKIPKDKEEVQIWREYI